MKKEYDLSKMKSRPNPYARKLKKQVTLRMSPDVVEYFKKMAEETRKSFLSCQRQGFKSLGGAP
jgi:tRNA G46 methylase TrmB